MPKTERAEAVCTTKEHALGEPFLIFEGPNLPSLPSVYFGMDLKPGTTREQAEELADQINAVAKGFFALFV